MARIRYSKFYNTFRRNVDGILYFTCYGKQCARCHVAPRNPRTAKQRYCRSRFTAAVKAWKKLATEVKER